jgi:hypothetical protein
MALLHQSARGEILKGDFQRSLDSLGSAAGKHDVLKVAAAQPQHHFGQIFERRARKEVSIAVGDVSQLPGDRRIDLGMCVSQAEHRGTARPVEVALAGGIE